jgi:hypothetical protein
MVGVALPVVTAARAAGLKVVVLSNSYSISDDVEPVVSYLIENNRLRNP